MALESFRRSEAKSVPGKLGGGSPGSRSIDDYLVLLKLPERYSEVTKLLVAKSSLSALFNKPHIPYKFDSYGSLLYLRRYNRARTGSGPKSQQTFVL